MLGSIIFCLVLLVGRCYLHEVVVVAMNDQDELKYLVLLALLGEKDGVDVRENTTAGDGDVAEKTVELLVVADGELDVSGDDSGLLVVSGGVTGKLKDLGGEVLEDGGKVDRGTGTNTGSVLALLEESADSAHRELKTSLGRSRSGLSGSTASLSSLSSFSWWHFVRCS